MTRHATPMTTRPCVRCGKPTVSKRWFDGRARKPKGVVKHQARGLCGTCYSIEFRNGRLKNWPVLEKMGTKPTVRLRCAAGQVCAYCEDVADLDDHGTSPWEWADRMGTTPINLQRNLYRHGKHDLARKLAPIVNEIRGPHQRKVAA